jgi:hypothetical protein
MAFSGHLSAQTWHPRQNFDGCKKGKSLLSSCRSAFCGQTSAAGHMPFLLHFAGLHFW